MEILLGIFGLVGAVWVLILLQRGGVMAVALATLAAGICFGAFFYQVSVVTSDRIMCAALLGLYVVARRTPLFQPKVLSALDMIGGALLLWLIGSALTHDWRANELQPLKTLFFYYLLPALMYWIARELPVKESSLKWAFVAVAIFGVYISLTAVLEWRQIHALVFPRYIVSPEFPEFFGRGRGPLLNPSGNGVLIGLAIAATAMCWPHAGLRLKPLVALGVMICLAGAFATLTRCVWLGVATSVFLLVAVAFPPKWKYPIILGSGLLLTLLVATNLEKLKSFQRDRNVSATEMSKSALLRPMLFSVAWRIFLDKPFTGVGYGHYGEGALPYYTHEIDFARDYVQHNVLLGLLSETGIIGMLLYMNLLITWSHTAWKLWARRTLPLPFRQLGLLFLMLTLSFLCNGMFQDVAIMPMVHSVFAFFGGLTMGHWLWLSREEVVSHQQPQFASNQLAGA